MTRETLKIVKAEKHEKKSLCECYRCGKNLYSEKLWYIAWTEMQNSIAEAVCRNCLAEEFLK